MDDPKILSKKIAPFEGLTFDDLLLLPSYADFKRQDIDLSTHLTRKIKLSIPLISAPMDTVTESSLAIELARLGGIGIIHRNMIIEKQQYEVKKVKNKKLLVGAAVGAGRGFEDRVKALVFAKTDVIVVDSAHGFAKSIIDTIKYIKKRYPKIEVIAGNISTYDAAVALKKAGADGLRVGMGPGAICTTRIVSGMGVPQITAILQTVKADLPVIADGGIKFSGDMVKALAAGASTVMMGSFFASAKESPGRVVKMSKENVPSRFKSSLTEAKTYLFKEYRGMGSEGAMRKGAKVKGDGEFHGKDYKDRILVAEGVEGYVPVKGTVKDLVEQSLGGIKSGMYYTGCKTIGELWKNAKFIKITQASLTESHPHSVLISSAGKNYSI